MELREKLQGLPEKPGIYIMKDSLENIIYVGKSRCLKNRVNSYFHASDNLSPKTENLVQNLRDFEVIVTDTEFEALMLECEYIHRWKPAYNRMMKNPDSYVYIQFVPYPMLEFRTVHEPDESIGGIYLGPFTRKNNVENTVEQLMKFGGIYCSYSAKRADSCLDYKLKRCIGMCMTAKPTEEYSNRSLQLLQLLEGKDDSLLKQLGDKMNQCASQLDFEGAAEYRDLIRRTGSLIKQNVVARKSIQSQNLLMLEPLNPEEAKYFLIRHNDILYSETGSLSNPAALEASMLCSVLEFFQPDPAPKKKKSFADKKEIDKAHILYSYMEDSMNNRHYQEIPNSWLSASSPQTEKIAVRIHMLVKTLHKCSL